MQQVELLETRNINLINHSMVLWKPASEWPHSVMLTQRMILKLQVGVANAVEKFGWICKALCYHYCCYSNENFCQDFKGKTLVIEAIVW